MAINTGQNSAGLPIGGAVTVGIANQGVCPPNPSRGGLWFINNSGTASIAICPATQWIIASGTAPFLANANTVPTPGYTPPAIGVAAINGPGSITLAPGQAQIIDNQNCGGAWNGIASAAGASLTILEF